MSKKILYLMCGPSGSGKSYFAKNILQRDYTSYISRDQIRFSIVHKDEGYFSHENEVFTKFVMQINEALHSDSINCVIADATHLNKASRMKLLKRLNLNGVNVIPVWMNTPEHICLERNKLRSGRECVPEDVIHKMYYSRNHPCGDNFKYAAVLEVSGL